MQRDYARTCDSMTSDEILMERLQCVSARRGCRGRPPTPILHTRDRHSLRGLRVAIDDLNGALARLILKKGPTLHVTCVAGGRGALLLPTRVQAQAGC